MPRGRSLDSAGTSGRECARLPAVTRVDRTVECRRYSSVVASSVGRVKSAGLTSTRSAQGPSVPRADSVDADSGITYSYHSEGHYKATLEDVFKNSSNVSLLSDHAPWSMGWQTNERNIMWNDDLKLRLIKKIVAQKIELSDAELDSRLQTLVSLLPDIRARLPSMKPETIARLLSERKGVAERLVALKQVFPSADCSKMVVKELGLLSESIDSLQERATALREFLPAVDIDKLVQDNPSVLSVNRFKAVVQDARRLMPGLHIESMLMSDPDFVLSLQKGTDMIPYDAIPDNPWGHK